MTVVAMAAWSKVRVALSRQQAAELASVDLVEVMPRGDDWILVSNSLVGVATGDGWEIRVRPRIDVPQLFFLLAYAADGSGWKDDWAEFSAEPDLVDAVANGFSWHAIRAIEQGLLRGYVSVEERLSTIRGRIRFSDQVARSATLPLPIEVAYDEYTSDIVENQMLKTAALALLRLRRIPPRTRQRLLKLRAVFEDVSVLPRPREAAVPTLTRLNQRYAPALRLAARILRASSIDAPAGPLAATAFVFDMNRVFEDFVTEALAEAINPLGGVLRPQVQDTSLDRGGVLALRPDLTWWVGGECRALIDAKYKAIDDGRMRHGDAYQMLAYCIAYDLPRGYLVYASDSGVEARMHTIRHSGHEIVVATLDVEKPPRALLEDVRSLAMRIAGAATASTVAA